MIKKIQGTAQQQSCKQTGDIDLISIHRIRIPHDFSCLNIFHHEEAKNQQINTTQDSSNILKNLLRIKQQKACAPTSQNQKYRQKNQLDQQIKVEKSLNQQNCLNEMHSQNIKKIFVQSIQKQIQPQIETVNLKKDLNKKKKKRKNNQMVKPKNIDFSFQQDDITVQTESLRPQFHSRQQHKEIQCSIVQGGSQAKINQQCSQLKHNLQSLQEQQHINKDYCQCEIEQRNAQNFEKKQSKQRIGVQQFELSRKQLLELFDKQQQQKRLQIFQQKFNQQKLKANKFIQRMPNRKIQRNIKALPAKFKQLPKIKELLLLEIQVDLISEIKICQAYDCQILNFLIPCLYLIASILNYYEYQSSKNLTIYYLFTQTIKKINKIMNKGTDQLTKEEILNHLVRFANYRKYTSQELNSMIGDFLKKHSLRMRGFMPAYYDLFCFHAFQKYKFIQSLQNLPDIRIKRQKISERLQKLWIDIRKKYHNQNL